MYSYFPQVRFTQILQSCWCSKDLKLRSIKKEKKLGNHAINIPQLTANIGISLEQGRECEEVWLEEHTCHILAWLHWKHDGALGKKRLTPLGKKEDPRSKEWGQKNLERFNTGKLNQGERYHCLEPNTVVETVKQPTDVMERNAAKDMKQKCEKSPRVKERVTFSFLIGFYLLGFYLQCNAEFPSVGAEIYHALILLPRLLLRSWVRVWTFCGTQGIKGTTSHCTCNCCALCVLWHKAHGLPYLQELSNICCI